ncbi:3',5'-cyclic AMP phosphodiesterase CpdA [Clostridium acetobutylicum]|uniref:Predicted phosphohydrolase, Icc family n=1 Tax=Clostridium acetobutylicum (strain ATCC 824 / DSM 792 / JCM 1419 / IAM 19013 / LMG 5710 / NBRC 13948 / NRRL B-527 / VKM B-1787 / 2291 / W) TaxID=272562 RepID=Q97FD4_CLOAB|nr:MULTISPECIES: metallophosphoesterase family protein [Clostridium]AAK80750.1 Predicted phosphohydrolase, Icc family [Clostridium acetobutylicum ATCC 824]ADZ21851.1 phosphohydrolase, Icc family [Clostridium acetobutylicum EA 2018]AEI32561.1 Icc family phosphohydrolase [Clostridium acetobutylicum DSM 1731]AWV78836.1 phosphohydrolase [Clostridium acetobutylicum]MBC2395073.1 metallophosphoesterase family protein [Clostridium acetobutylicum]
MLKEILKTIILLLQRIFKGGSREIKQKFKVAFKEGKFKIVQFTDLHEHAVKNEYTIKLMENILDSEKPNLVVITGDCVDGRYCNGEKEVKGVIDNIAKPMEDRRIPWAVTLGNHDSEACQVSRERQMEIYMSYKYNLSDKFSTVSDKAGDYNIVIQDENNKPVYNLYMLDSGSYTKDGYGYVEKEQIAWYEDTANNLKKCFQTRIPSLMFFHIPLKQQYEVWQSGKAVGERNENECCQGEDTGLFSKLKEIGDVKGVFVGHDHTNDYWGSLDGIALCYGRKTGFNCYDKEGFIKGARVIVLNENHLEEFNTYEKLDV